MAQPVDFEGWVPFRLYWEGQEPGVEWCYLGTKAFTDPFFETTAQVAVQTPFNSLFRFRTPMADLREWSGTSPGLPPTGFIFHLSRCGSTLIAQLLASLPENIVLSEPGLLAAMLRSHMRAVDSSEEQRVLWLQWLVSALGQRRTGVERQFFIKFDPANILELPLLRLAFPDVPWIFVYRDPVEVLVSHLRSPSPLTTRGMLGPDCLAFDPGQVLAMEDDEYAARALGIVAEAAVRLASAGRAMLVNYSQLPDLVWTGLPEHFGMTFTPEHVKRFREIAAFHAKHPRDRFLGDTEEKQREASASARELASRWIAPHYFTLEKLRAFSEFS
jgi:hypothetical protein